VLAPATVTNPAVMAGLGETAAELVDVFRDLGSRGVDILTVGQYLRPRWTICLSPVSIRQKNSSI